MSRIDRIREDIVSRVARSADYWDERKNREISATSMLESGRLGRHLWRQTEGRRRQIVKRLLDLTAGDMEDKL